MNDDDARDCTMQIEALYQISRRRRLSNSETVDLADLSSRLAVKARHEATRRVPEFQPIQFSRRYW